jgi:hypothetical protein
VPRGGGSRVAPDHFGLAAVSFLGAVGGAVIAFAKGDWYAGTLLLNWSIGALWCAWRWS